MSPPVDLFNARWRALVDGLTAACDAPGRDAAHLMKLAKDTLGAPVRRGALHNDPDTWLASAVREAARAYAVAKLPRRMVLAPAFRAQCEELAEALQPPPEAAAQAQTRLRFRADIEG